MEGKEGCTGILRTVPVPTAKFAIIVLIGGNVDLRMGG